MVSKQITRAEFYDKYGEVYVTFSWYGKCVFHYGVQGDDGLLITVEVGGEPDAIRDHEVSAGISETIKRLEPFAGNVYRYGKLMENFYDY